MKIVILGYSGLIGHSILENLLKNTSFNLVCVGRTIENKFLNNPRINYFEWDFVTFKNSNLNFLKNANIIINCVGKTNYKSDTLEYINVIYLKKLLKYLSKNQKKVRFINLSSVSVYGDARNYIGQNKLIKENTTFKTYDAYSRSKLKGDKLIRNIFKKKLNKNLSFTILRISNVFGKNKNSNLFNFVLFLLKIGIWIKSSNSVVYNFINVKDVSQAVKLVITKLAVSKNKTYIVSDDFKQSVLYQKYQKINQKKETIITFPIYIIKFLINYLPLPRIILNFFLLISSEVSYSNKKIKRELKFNPKYSLKKEIKKI